MTPMMKQWHAAKSKHKDGILFFRMGDFYEFFHDDAKKASKLLGLTLTSRSKGDGGIAMAGIPVKTVGAYIKRLVELGEKVVVCDQLEDPALAKGIVERDVTRIITPGTLTEDDSLDAKDNNYLAAFSGSGVAWVDLSTGDFATRECSGETIIEAIDALEPSECLVPETWLHETEEGKHLAASSSWTISARPDWCFEAESARRSLNNHFGTRTLDGFGVDEMRFPIGAAGAILDYLEETQRGAVGQIRRIRCCASQPGMAIDRTSRVALELVRTVRDNDRPGSLLGIMDRCKTAMGSRLLKQWILSPLLDRDKILARQEAANWFLDNQDVLSEVRRQANEILDLERLAGRLGCGRANPRDLAALRQSLRQIPEVLNLIANSQAKLLRRAANDAPDTTDLEKLLGKALVESPPLNLSDGGVICEGYDEKLDELRSIGREGKGFIAGFQKREIEATGIQNLKIGFNKVFGYYLEVSNGNKDKVPPSYIRKQTLKNAERYITPELKEYEDKVLNAEDKARAMELGIFESLRSAATCQLDALQELGLIIARVDVLQSFARLAIDDDYTRPEIVDDDVLEIEEGRHPVLVRIGTPEPFVPNDLELDESQRFMLITGPNMAGKSTYIRQFALLVLMSQIGSFIPAKKARVGLVDRIFTRIGASDDLAAGSSTFMVEMLEVANILNNATSRSLVILDEVGRGTSTYDGLALAWAITEHLAQCRVKSLFATHYHELTKLEESLPGVVNYNVAVKEWGEEIVFLHRIVRGCADKSYGIHVARLAGIPQDVLNNARHILQDLEDGKVGRRQDWKTPQAGEVLQLDLFEAAPDPLREKLKDLDVNSLTPLAALNFLNDLCRDASI